MSEKNGLEWLTDILEQAKKQGASDVHLVPDGPVMIRIDGRLVRMPEGMPKARDIETMLEYMLAGAQKEALERAGELNFAYSMPDIRLRVSAFRQSGTYAMALRLLPLEIPMPEQLLLPEAVVGLAGKKQGLVLVTGASGSGVSTTLAALVGVAAQSGERSIITIEDPVEYLYPHSSTLVQQREIGSDSESYACALRAALRQDADVILVGELRDADTLSAAILAAESGHLVFSAQPCCSAEASVDRIIEMFPGHQQAALRGRFAAVLLGVVAQQLLPCQSAAGRVAAFEILLANPAVHNAIREAKIYQIPALLQAGAREGMQVMDDAIYDLYMKSSISAETAISCAHDVEGMRQKVQLF